MDHITKIQKLLQIEKWKWLFLVGLVALTHLFCQSLMLPYGNALLSLLANEEGHNLLVTVTVESSNNYSVENQALSTQTHNFDGHVDMKGKGKQEKFNFLSNDDDDVDDADDDFDFVEDEALGNENVDLLEDEIITPKDVRKELGFVSLESNVSGKGFGAVVSDAETTEETVNENKSVVLSQVKHKEPDARISPYKALDLSYNKGKEISNSESHVLSRTSFVSSENGSLASNNKPGKKKMRSEMPPKTVTPLEEMEKLLVHHRARSRAMRPRWSSERDQEILRAKTMIENAPVLKNERELYAKAFRNISAFKRSYELMERLLKIYVYKEGEKPIFHQPILKGLYASEGWFMKLMEGNKRFVVKDPRRAHLYYMPFSSRMLEHTLYVRNSHNRTNLRQHLRDYSEKIASKYRFWNRTGGADHFLVACHDWAPYETRHHMEHCIKALCNADVTIGFKIGRDVSLPETYVRSARNPLRDLGGKPPSQRHILAFYAGNVHGYLRPILLKHWKDKDPDMKILGPMPSGVASKMTYISYMKSSKYCICPKGYEVNSPRVVEAIFYECVPVIISDNFVPPFFEVLNWDAFSVIVAEKDVPNLKNILVSISQEKYLEMQLGVRSVQRHFLWHAKPLKYDLFHMTLHSIWYNRVFQLKVR